MRRLRDLVCPLVVSDARGQRAPSALFPIRARTHRTPSNGKHACSTCDLNPISRALFRPILCEQETSGLHSQAAHSVRIRSKRTSPL